MSHLRLVEPTSPPPGPKAVGRVTKLLRDALRYGEERRVVECVVVTREADGTIGLSFSGTDPLKLVGLLEAAKQDILLDV